MTYLPMLTNTMQRNLRGVSGAWRATFRTRIQAPKNRRKSLPRLGFNDEQCRFKYR